MNRRQILKGAGGFFLFSFSAAVLPFAKTDHQRFVDQLKDGAVIAHQEFSFPDNYVIDLRDYKNLEIHHCKFWLEGTRMEIITGQNQIHHCWFMGDFLGE
jgi:hypothetical protein